MLIVVLRKLFIFFHPEKFIFFSCLLSVFQVSAQNNLPVLWNNSDVGNVNVSGSAIFTSDTFTIQGAGKDIWDYYDEFHYVYQKRKGNFEIISKITPQSKLNGWAKSGLMIRETLDPNSKHGMFIKLPDNRISFIKRESTGDITTLPGPLITKNSGWFKLRRHNNMLIAYESDDGVDWSVFYYTNIVLNEQVYVGLAVSSHVPNTVSKTFFTHVSVLDRNDSLENKITAPHDVLAKNITNHSVELGWTNSASADVIGFNIYAAGKKLNSNLNFSNCYSISGLAPDTEYIFSVAAVDLMGNVSSPSLPVTITTKKSLEDSDYVIPLNNPFSSAYEVSKHWTDEIKWKEVTDASKVDGLISRNFSVDSVKLHDILSAISEKGGGVLFFPPGKYFFDYHFKLYDGVVIRGADPLGDKSECHCNYIPTKFEFPKYKPSFTNKGTDNKTAFKKIISDTTGIKNFGLVNLDINRATIEFLAGGYKRGFLARAPVIQPSLVHRNVIIYGIRQNNAIIPSPDVPTKIMVDESKSWQRWPLDFAANVNIWAAENCLIARSKFNDHVTDDYGQKNYLTDDFFMMDSAQAMFRFIPRDVIVINSNFHKTYYLDNKPKRYDFFEIWQPYWDYRFIASKNIELLDNYIIGFEHEAFEPIKSDGFVKGNFIKIHKLEESITQEGIKSVANDWQKIALSDTIFEKHVFESNIKISLPYRLMKPKYLDRNKKYPLVLYLHGAWEAGNDNVNHLKHSVTLFVKSDIRNNYPAYVLCPQHDIEESFVSGNIGSPSSAMAATMLLVDSLIKSESIDTQRIYIFGISSGGGATVEALMQYPNRFAAALVLSSLYDGFIDKKKIKIIKDQPLWFFFGEKDQNCPPQYVNFTISRLREVNESVKLTIYPDFGHGIFVKIFEDPKVLQWLFSQQNRNKIFR